MRVVVVGATGNVGTAVVESLAGEPAVDAVLGIARRAPEWAPPKTDWAVGDVGEDDLRPFLQGADVVVHLAWLFQPTHDPLVTWQANAVGSTRVFRAAADAKVPALVYASSVGAYSPGPKDRPVDETWPTHSLPTAAYGREKAYVERALDSFVHEHPDRRVVRLRPGFIFKRRAATEQRRLFAGPLLPGRLVRPGLVPIMPDFPGLVFQALHADDAAEAYRLAVVTEASGPFNVAASPVIDAGVLADLFEARRCPVPGGAVRAAMAAAWHLRLAPAAPALLDLVRAVPVMDTTRAESVLGWKPRFSAVDAIGEFVEGLRAGAGMATAPLEPDTPRGRLREFSTGVGGDASIQDS